MTNTAKEVARMVDILPDSEQMFALELVKRLVLAWNPDYIEVTPTEAEALRLAEAEFARGDFVREDAIDWK